MVVDFPPPPKTIVVTGEALPDRRSEAVLAVVALDRTELVNSPSHHLEDILRLVPSVQLFRRSDSASAHPTSQGVTLRALGGNAASRVLVVLDGVPQIDPFGGWVNWPAFDPAGLESLRIIRGGGAVTYGPGALAGAIEMNSHVREEQAAGLEVGSRKALSGRVYWGQHLGASILTVSALGESGNGFVPITRSTRGTVDQRAPYQEASFRARLVAPIAANIELQSSLLGFIDKRERGVPFTGNVTHGGDASFRLVGSGPWSWSATLYAQARNFRSSFARVGADRDSAERVSMQDSVPSTGYGASVEVRPRLGGTVELTIGADARFTVGESRELYGYEAGQPSRRRIAGGDSSTHGIFADASRVEGSLTLAGGIRLDHWAISRGHLRERALTTGAELRNDEFGDRSGWRPTGRAGVAFDLGSGLTVRSTAYLGWRLPTLNELFRPFRAGSDATAANASLHPERLAGIEAGLTYAQGGLSLSVTAFINHLKGAIANVTLGHGPGIFPGVGFVAGTYSQRQNLGAVHVRGLELSANYDRGAWKLGAQAAYNDAKVRDRGAASALDGLRPAQTPKFSATATVGWQRQGRGLTLQLRHVSAQLDDDLNRTKLKGATALDAFAAIPLGRRWQLVGRGENLFDATVIAAIGDQGSVERARPRTLWIGLRFGDRGE